MNLRFTLIGTGGHEERHRLAVKEWTEVCKSAHSGPGPCRVYVFRCQLTCVRLKNDNRCCEVCL